jgi:serine protease Do
MVHDANNEPEASVAAAVPEVTPLPTPSLQLPERAPEQSAPGPDSAASVYPAATNTRPTKTAPEVAAAVRHAVVEIMTETVTSGGWGGTRVAEGAGSGVIMSTEGYIITNDHVITGAGVITVRLADGREFTATLIATDPKTDIAVLRITASNLTPAVFGDSSRLDVGESALAVGNPLGELGGTVTGGIISALDRDIVVDGQLMTLLQTDAAVNPGNSGGGLFNMNAELIGIVNAKSVGLNIEGLGFAIPSDTARAVAGDLIVYGYVKGRPETGLEVIDIQTSQAARTYRVSELGLYIISSTDDRLRVGDRITAVNDRTVAGMMDYYIAMKGLHAGDMISVTVVRDGQRHTYDLTLTEWSP